MTDPIADMLNRIKNAQAVKHETVSFSFSKIKYEIALLLQKNGFIKDVEKKGKKEKRAIKIILKNEGDGLDAVKRVSKPGQRVYIALKDIKPVRAGYGISIISTPKGLMTGKEARRKKLGGEIICKIW